MADGAGRCVVDPWRGAPDLTTWRRYTQRGSGKVCWDDRGGNEFRSRRYSQNALDNRRSSFVTEVLRAGVGGRLAEGSSAPLASRRNEQMGGWKGCLGGAPPPARQPVLPGGVEAQRDPVASPRLRSAPSLSRGTYWGRWECASYCAEQCEALSANAEPRLTVGSGSDIGLQATLERLWPSRAPAAGSLLPATFGPDPGAHESPQAARGGELASSDSAGAVAPAGALAPKPRKGRRRCCQYCSGVIEKGDATTGYLYHSACWQAAAERRAPALAEVRAQVESTNAVAAYLVAQTQNRLPSLLVPSRASLTVSSAKSGAAPDASQITRVGTDAWRGAPAAQGGGTGSNRVGTPISTDAVDNRRLGKHQAG